jgi:hypothetical protein
MAVKSFTFMQQTTILFGVMQKEKERGRKSKKRNRERL